MAYTRIQDIITPEVLGDQISAKFPDKLVFGGTNLVDVDSTFPLGQPGVAFKLPFWKRLQNGFTALTEGTAMTASNITTAAEWAVVQRAGLAVAVYDTAELVSKADPVGEIADQIGRKAAEYIDASLVTTVSNTPNTLDYTSNSGTGGKLDQNGIIQALQTLGDNSATLQSGGAIIMHSKVYADLLQTAAIQNQYQSGMDVIKTGMMPTLLGMPIFVSDLVTVAPLSSGSTTNKYTTFLVGKGALALFYQRQVMVEFDRDILLTADFISANVHFAPHLYGYNESTNNSGPGVVAEQNKSIHAVTLVSK